MVKLPWWQTAVIYQIYPRSFQDSDGDGVGDLEGVRRRLDYLVDLGVDAIWLSPFFTSPMADFGYDVADYCDVDPLFGSLRDFDALLRDAHARDLKVIVDFVPNHTSDQHPWFVESRGSRDNDKRDWYLWRDGAMDGGPPNNWLSNFGGSAWALDAATGQYYYHAFLREQPDLNWRNPAVRIAMYDVMRFWLQRGVDGFRIDVLFHLIKDDLYRDNPRNPSATDREPAAHALLPLYTADRPEVQEIVIEMRQVADEFSRSAPRVLIGEIYLPLDRLMAYYGRDQHGVLQGVQLPFNFQLIGAPWQAAAIDGIVRAYELALPVGGWPNWVLGNHDKARIASRVGQDQARAAAMLLLTLRGTPTMYYGDEIGMADVDIPSDEVHDPFEKNEPGAGQGRDPERTPMQWNGATNAGFTTGMPWLRLGGDFASRNVEALSTDPRSLLQLYRALITLRRQQPALSEGLFEAIGATGDMLAFVRVLHAQRLLVLINFGAAPCSLPESLVPRSAKALLSTYLDRSGPLESSPSLRANEGLILDVPSMQ